ncbi:hypothetical protein SPI_03043 [Niveomyces insectorum RCEF 264]|uniref:Amidohydrolase-related domain-containing protein n=1 Tax=Niveomyces insectorum RCEF 264 TaxID=1081102 RepID=A0A167X0U4_9HYPO|nr:hypothetical protein SPI_03043 [Niveomyces insectorum RCEF 264]
MDAIPPGAWDTHVHVFDPVRHPYIPGTRYTPPARSVDDLVAALPSVTNFVIVMSGPEGTDAALTLETIATLQHRRGRDAAAARGVVVVDVDDDRQMAPGALQALHRGGRGGRGAVFGSDWPHVDSTPGSTALLAVDLPAHLRLLKATCDGVGPGMWERLMRDNAAALYA